MLFFWGVVLLFPSFLLGGELKLSASVNQKKIGIEDQLVLTVTVEGSDLKGIKEPDLPDLEGFSVLGTSSSQSTNISLVNGKMTTSKTISYDYSLAPEKEGEIIIGPANLSFGGKNYSTEPIKIQVVPGSVGGTRRSTSRPGAQQSPQDLKLNPEDVQENIFLSSWPDRKKVYVGEQVTLDFTLYSRYNLVDLSLSKAPVYEGFWAEDIFNAKRLEYSRQVVKGTTYNAALLKRVALFPLSSGTRTVEPMELICGIQLRSNDFFDFFGRRENVKVAGRPVTIEVLPLPSAGKPASFNGAVGNFTINALVDKETVPTNEAISVKIEISGTGNIFSIAEPEISLPSDFEKYETQESESHSAKGTRISGKKSYEYVLVPRVPGEYTIPPIEFSFFDPEKEIYQTLRTQPVNITVIQGDNEFESGLKVVSKGEVINVGRDIEYIKPDRESLPLKSSFHQKGFNTYLWLPLEIMLVLIALVYKQRKRRIIEDSRYARNIKAYSKARQILKEAVRTQKANPTEAYGKISNALMGYIADRMDLPPAGLIFRDCRLELQKRGVGNDLVDALEQLLEQSDIARFAPGKIETSLQDNLKKAIDMLKKLDRKLK